MRSPDGLTVRLRAVAASTAALVGLVAVLLLPALAFAASPSPTPASGVGDPRSSGQGPGLVGDPLTAILVVAGIALLSLVATLAYVRATGGGGGSDPR